MTTIADIAEPHRLALDLTRAHLLMDTDPTAFRDVLGTVRPEALEALLHSLAELAIEAHADAPELGIEAFLAARSANLDVAEGMLHGLTEHLPRQPEADPADGEPDPDPSR